MARTRVAVVLLLPQPAATEVTGIQRALGSAEVGRVAPHITLVPPVNVRSEALPTVLAAVRAAAARTRPLATRIGPAASFWPDTPVLYLAVHGELESLRASLDAGPLGRPREWPFVPHVTLVADREPAELDALTRSFSTYACDVTFDRLHVLVQQEDRSWQTLADAAFGGAHVVGRGGLEVAIAETRGLDPEGEAFFGQAWAAHLAASYGPLPPTEPFALTARCEGRVVGVAIGTTADELRLDRLVVDPSVRRTGVGRHLLRAVEALGAARGCSDGLLVVQARGPAEAFYLANGWTIRAPLPAWAHGRDFVRMGRVLRRAAQAP